MTTIVFVKTAENDSNILTKYLSEDLQEMVLDIMFCHQMFIQ